MRSGGEAAETTRDRPTAGRGKAVPRRVVAPALVGREDELELLASAVAEPPAVVVVEGEAGIGKTRLIAELGTRPEVAGHRFVVGLCRRVREPLPLGPVLDVVYGLGEELAKASLSPVAGSLRPLLPEIAHLLPAQPEPLEDRLDERHRVFRALVEVLAWLGPAVVVVEDLHWADEQTVEFVSYLLADPPPVLSLVLTLRDDEAEPRVRALTAKPPAQVHQVRTVLSPLDTEQTGALAAAILGVDRVPAEVATRLCHRASGVPFVIEELLALLPEQNVWSDGGRWAVRVLDELEVPHAIRDYVRERVARLPWQARPVLEVTAVLHEAAPERLVAAVLDVPLAEVSDGLSHAIDAGLVVAHDDAVEFRHVLAAQAVYEGIPAPRRRRWHDRAADALAAEPAPPLGQVAYHLKQAGRLDEWSAAAERAADQAVELGHDAEVVRLLEDVLRHAPLRQERRSGLAVKLARAATEIVHGHEEVVALLTQVLEGEPRRTVRGELRFWLAALVDLMPDAVLRERQLFAEAVRELGSTRPDLRAWGMMALGIPMGDGVPVAEHKRWLRRSVALLPQIGNPGFEVFLLGKIAMALGLMGDRQWRRFADRLEKVTGDPPDSLNEANAYHSVGEMARVVGHHHTAVRLMARARTATAESGSRSRELGVEANFALLDYCRGAWDGLGGRVEALLDALASFPKRRSPVEVVAGCLGLAHGDLDTARRHLTEVVRYEHARALESLPTAASALIRLALARGEVETATMAAERVLAVVESKGLWAPAVRALPYITQAVIAADRLAQGRRLVTLCSRMVNDLDAPLALASLEHAGGFLDAAVGRWRPAADHFLAAAQHYQPLLCPYEAAHAYEQAAVCGFAAQDGRAEEALRSAAGVYRRLGADWDYARAARTARQHGLALPVRYRGGPPGYGRELSPREREVATLAASGRTNKEIAQELFVSTKTIDKHLSAALRKLQLRSRTELARHLSATDSGRRSTYG